MMETNGGPIDAEDTTDGKDYVMVTRAVFDAFEQEYKQWEAAQEYELKKLAEQNRVSALQGHYYDDWEPERN
jgi:hypothetical protein